MRPFFLIFLISFIFLFSGGWNLNDVFAQSEDTIFETGGDYTGTYSDEDPENENLKTEAELFGPDEAGEVPEEETLPTHLLELHFEGHVVVVDKETTVPYLEIFYTVKIEREIEIKEKRSRLTALAEITTDIVGTLAGNALFSCALDIGGLSDIETDIMIAYSIIPETEELPELTQLAAQIKFEKKLEEDWFADCLSGEYTMKTQGDPEEYLNMIWDNIRPDLKALLFENYDIGDAAQMNLVSETVIIDDENTGDEYEISGQGELVIEPL